MHLLDPVVADAGVIECFGARFLHHLRVVPALAGSRLLNLGHPDADHEDTLVVLTHVVVPPGQTIATVSQTVPPIIHAQRPC